jgi:uncharacterized protein (UPF0332 family)
MSALFGQAQASAESARFLLSRGSYDGACALAYLAVFNSARAVLASRGLQVGRLRSAKSVSRLLSRTFGAATQEWRLLETLRLADDTRRVADYEGGDVAPATATHVLESMDQFMSRARDLLADHAEVNR